MNISGNRRAMRTANNYVDQGVLTRLKAKPFPAGTVIFPKIGAAIATNKKRLLIKPSLVDNNVMGVWPTDPERLTSDFLYYWLLSVDLRTLSAIGPLPSIAQHAVQNALISLPSLDEQRAISKVLTAVEGARDAIENVIAATRELKRSFVRHLFTYGPVPIDHAEEVPLKDTEVGSIPDHWRVATIRETGRVVTGTTPSTKHSEYYGGSIPFITPAELDVGKHVIATPRTLTEAGGSQSRLLPSYTVLVSCIGYIGKVGLTRGPVSATNQQINAVIPAEGVEAEFLYYAMVKLVPLLQSRAAVTTLPILNKSNFEATLCPLPPVEEQLQIALILASLDAKIEAEVHRREALDGLFNSLLAGLITGRRRVVQSEVA